MRKRTDASPLVAVAQMDYIEQSEVSPLLASATPSADAVSGGAAITP